jgi:lipid-binding SYLF domain-containing protein
MSPSVIASGLNPATKGDPMKRRILLLACSAGLVAACSTPGEGTADPAAKKRAINAEVDGALADLYAAHPGSKELASKAQGILVFPKVVSAGFLVGGSYGQGALRKGSATAGYYSVGAGSVGLLAGAQTKAMYILFMTPEALQKFESSNGWTAGADASVVVMDEGAAGRVDTRTATAPVIGFVRSTGGLMANLSLDGTKFNKLTI